MNKRQRKKKLPRHLCRCKVPDLNVLAGRYNCGGAYVCPCTRCGKMHKWTTTAVNFKIASKNI